jgi:hypothetical protein
MKNQKKIRVSFDIGGVLSKYPDIWRPVFHALQQSPLIEVFVITDMHKPEQSMKMLIDNGFSLKNPKNLINSDYPKFGEACKAINQVEHQIDIHIDDFPGYIAAGAPVRLMVMPDVKEPYYHESWITDGAEGDFGRKKKDTFCEKCFSQLKKDEEHICP